MIFDQSQLGFSITKPFKHVARTVAHGTASVAKSTAHVAKKVASPAVALAVLPAVELNKIVVGPVVKRALKPVTNRINTLKDRRAKKLAWDRRKSPTPTPAEHAESKSWAKNKLRGETPPFGLMLSLLAGPLIVDESAPQMHQLGEPATASVLASIPALIALMNTILARNAKSGEAPASTGGGAPTAAGGRAAASPGGDPNDTPSDAAQNEGNSGATINLPGVGHVRRTYVMIGGAVLGGVLLLVLLAHKKT